MVNSEEEFDVVQANVQSVVKGNLKYVTMRSGSLVFASLITNGQPVMEWRLKEGLQLQAGGIVKHEYIKISGSSPIIQSRRDIGWALK